MSEQRNVFCLKYKTAEICFNRTMSFMILRGGGNSSILINLHDTEEEKYEPENEKYRFYSFLSAQ